MSDTNSQLGDSTDLRSDDNDSLHVKMASAFAKMMAENRINALVHTVPPPETLEETNDFINVLRHKW